MFDFRIVTFLTVCDTLNYTKAAEKLGLTQPAVSQHIHYLEKEYEIRLFQKSGKQIFITPEGEILRQTAASFLNDEKIMKERLRTEKKSELPLRLGATVTIGEFLLIRPVSEYIRQHPDRDVHLTIANTSELISRLQSGEIHFALVEGYFDAKIFESMVFRTERFVPVCSVNHVFKREPEKIEDLFTERLLLREEGSGTREILEKSIGVQGYRLTDFTREMEVNSMYAIVQFLLENCGISFLYLSAVKTLVQEKKLKVIELQDYTVHHDFTFIWNRESVFGREYQETGRELIKYSV